MEHEVDPTIWMPPCRICGELTQVDLSIINGEVVVRDGKLLTLDVDALMEEHNAVSQRICSHILPAKA